MELDEFMSCPSNLANNRQTRMLANLSLVHCYDVTAMPREERESIMLKSAKDNLQDMAFFGLVEFQVATQYLFERTFKLTFIKDFEQYAETHAGEANISVSDLSRVRQVNNLDLELYKFAKQLFFQRIEFWIEEDIKHGRTDLIPESLADWILDGGLKIDESSGLSRSRTRNREIVEEPDIDDDDEEEEELEEGQS